MEKAKTLLEIARIISGNDDDVLASGNRREYR